MDSSSSSEECQIVADENIADIQDIDLGNNEDFEQSSSGKQNPAKMEEFAIKIILRLIIHFRRNRNGEQCFKNEWVIDSWCQDVAQRKP